MFRLGPMLIVGLIAVVCYAGNAAAQSTMSAQEIRARVIGNTVTGVEDSERYAEYLSPDGRVLGRTASSSYSGNWRIEGDELCVFYAGLEQGESYWGCSALRLNGNQLVWVDPDGDVVTTLSEGNAEYLTAEGLSAKPAPDPSFADVGMRRQPADPASTRTEPANDTGRPAARVAAEEGAPAASSAGRPAAQGAPPAAGAPTEAAMGPGLAPQLVAPGATAAPAAAPKRVGDATAASIEAPMRETDVRAADEDRSERIASVTTHARARKANAQPAPKAAPAKLAAASQKPHRVHVVRRFRPTNDNFAPTNQHAPTFGPE